MQSSEDTRIQRDGLTPVEFINKTYEGFSLYDLNDALVTLSKSISSCRQRHRFLIPKHFSRFIHCKNLLERIKDDFFGKNMQDQKHLDSYIATLQSKFDGLVKASGIDMNPDTSNAVTRYKERYSVLFTLRETLAENILNFEKFTDALRTGREAFEEVKDSKFFQGKFAEIQPVIRSFLENIYEYIVDPKVSFEESCYLFDYYFEVSGGKSDSKIMNTMLVHFKESTYNKQERSEEYYTYLIRSLVRLLRYVCDDQAIDGIHHFFNCIRSVLEDTDPQYSRTIIRRVGDFQKSLKAPPYCLKEFRDSFSDMKIGLFSMFVQRCSIREAPEIFDVFLSIMKDREVRASQEILLKKSQSCLAASKLTGVEYLNSESDEIRTIRPCLGSKDSKNIKALEKSLREKRNEALALVADDFRKLFDCYDDTGVLMGALRIIEDIPDYCSRVFVECRDQILERPVVTYHMHTYLGIDTPVLGEDEKRTVKDMEFQFGHMLRGR